MQVRGRRRMWAAWGAVVLVAATAACSAAIAPPEVDVSGEPGGVPTVTYVSPLTVSSTYREAIWPGTGDVLVDGGPVLFDFWLEDATTASVVSETYDSKPEARVLTREALGDDLYETLKGQRAGARILQVAPAVGTTDYPSVTVIDVLPLRASGEAVEPRADLPAVTVGQDGVPVVTGLDTDPATAVIAQPLLRGTGLQVGDQDTVTFQYTIFTWGGEPVDSSWSRGQPVSKSLLDLPEPFADALVEQTVGSQIELVIPPSEPMKITESTEYEGQTLVYVVDLLVSRTPNMEGGA